MGVVEYLCVQVQVLGQQTGLEDSEAVYKKGMSRLYPEEAPEILQRVQQDDGYF